MSPENGLSYIKTDRNLGLWEFANISNTYWVILNLFCSLLVLLYFRTLDPEAWTEEAGQTSANLHRLIKERYRHPSRGAQQLHARQDSVAVRHCSSGQMNACHIKKTVHYIIFRPFRVFLYMKLHVA